MRRTLPAAVVAAILLSALTACGDEPPRDPGERPDPTARTAPSEQDLARRAQRITAELSTACPAPDPVTAAPPSGPAPTDAVPTDAAATGAPVPPWLEPAEAETPDQALGAAARGSQEQLGIPVSIGLRRHADGSTTAVGAPRSYPSASLSKAPVALAYLRRQRDLGIDLTEQDRQMIEAAIVRSDNEAAARNYLLLGATEPQRRDALQQTLDLLGTEQPVVSDLPGLNPTTVEDQLRVLESLQSPPPGLHEEDAALVRGLMAVPGADGHRFDDSQDFGMGSLARPLDAPAAQDVHVKNGWIDDRLDGFGTWSAGTIGFGNIQGADYDLVVLLDGAPSDDCAFAVLDAMAEVSARSAGS